MKEVAIRKLYIDNEADVMCNVLTWFCYIIIPDAYEKPLIEGFHNSSRETRRQVA